jgi:hypothetical protein
LKGGPAGRDRTELVRLSYQLVPGPADRDALTDCPEAGQACGAREVHPRPSSNAHT